MKKHKKKTTSHGAISVFLTIILVPCIVVTCVFGDLSRVQLSRATAESAGDLSLYTLMSNYDEDLKEYYGLMSSCQTIDDFYQKSASYFSGMLAAQGVSGEGSELFMNYLNGLRSGDYSDLLSVELSNVEVSAAKDGAVGDNPALIEDGIVEFMKYRGPIQITTNLIDRFKSLNLQKGVSEVDENKEVIDAKKEYAEKQGELLKAAFYSYLAIRKYDREQENSKFPSHEKYATIQTELSNIRDDLRAVTSLTARYYYPGSEQIRWVNIPYFSISSDYSEEDIGIETETEEGTIYCIDNSLLESLLKGIDDEITSVEQAVSDFMEKTSDIPNPGNGTNEVVYCIKMQEAMDESKLVSTLSGHGKNLMKAYDKLTAAAACVPLPEGDDLPSDWEAQIEEACKAIDKVYQSYLNPNGSTSSDYFKKIKQYTNTIKTTDSKVKNKGYTFTSKLCGGEVTVGDFIGNVASRLPEYYSRLTEQRDRLNLAIDGGEIEVSGEKKTVCPLDELVNKAAAFTNSRDSWGSEASSHSTAYAQQEYQLYQGANSAAQGGGADSDEVAGEKIAAKITAQGVAELKSRLENIRSDINACLDALDAFTYGGTAVKDLRDANGAVGAANTVVPENNDFSDSAAAEASRGYADSLISPLSDEVCKAPEHKGGEDGNNPALGVEPPKLYEFFKNQFGADEDAVEKAIAENDKNNKDYEEAAQKEKDSAKGVSAETVVNKGSDLADVHGGATVTALSALGSVVSLVDNLMNGRGDELRDRLYVCEYIMDMFSYSDFDNEGKYRLALESNPGVSYKDFPYADQNEAWEAEDVAKVLRNQSLTNQPIKKANNHANLGEVEYVLYGSPSIDANLTTSYGNIFAIREIFNLVSGFSNFYTDGVITTIAGSVMAATMGVVPVPLTKCVLIGVLATLESSSDLNRLKKGARVELLKAKSDWLYKISGDLKASFDLSDATGTESGLYYSDYMYIFLMLGLMDDSVYSSMLLRVGDLIQANMRLMAKDEDYTLTKAISYFSLTGDVRVKPLMLTIPFASDYEGSNKLVQSVDWCSYKINILRGYS